VKKTGRDLIAELFQDEPFFAEEFENYPGSKKKRRPVNAEVAKRRATSEATWDAHPIEKTLPNGRTVEMFTAGSLATALGRPLVTVRLWERKGYIPIAPYRMRDVIVRGEKKPGKRLYSRALIEAAIEAFSSRGLLMKRRIDWAEHRDLSIALVEKWTYIHLQETN
jgi:hypothetical protein